MALGFFRKRQKLIFVIMVVLMVSFLIGYQGFSMLFQKSPAKTVIGRTSEFKVTLGMLRAANSDLQTLQWLGRGFGEHSLEGAALNALYLSAPRLEEQSLPYVILLEQAKEEGYAVTDIEIDGLIQQMKRNGMDFDAYAMHVRQNQGVPVKQLRALLGRWLVICKACRANQTVIPPSREQLVQLFRDLAEGMNLRVVKISAENFTKDVKAPTKEQVAEMFEEYKNRPAGDFAGIESFSFGYLQPARVKLSYLFISQTAIERAVMPSDREIMDYINEHEAELVKTEGAGDTVKTVPLPYEEKRAAAMAKLQPAQAQAKFVDILDRVRALARQAELGKDAPPREKVYQSVVEKLTFPADDVLARKVLVLAIDAQPLHQAIDRIAQQATPSIAAICFPYGQEGKVKIAPDVKVTLNATNLTVGEALEKIVAQIPDMPKLTWATFDGIDNAIFPVTGVRLFPVTAGRTGLETGQELAADPFLQKARVQKRVSLAQLAMRVDPIAPKSKFKVGQDGPTMQVWDPGNGGALVWRVTEAVPSKSPEALTEAIRKDVIRDWKLQQAFPPAKAKAETIKNAADLEKYIKAGKIKPIKTGMFARKIPRGLAFQPMPLMTLGLRAPTVDAHVIREAFAKLAPTNLNGEYSKESIDVLILPLPCEGYVLVAQRIDFVPAETKAFEKDKAGLIQFLELRQKRQAIYEWFHLAQIKKRTGFEEKVPEKNEQEEK